MDPKYVFVIFDIKDQKTVQKKIESRSKDQIYIYDDITKAQSVIYFASSSSEKNQECQNSLKYARDNNMPIKTIQIGGVVGTVIAALVIMAFLALVFYQIVF